MNPFLEQAVGLCRKFLEEFSPEHKAIAGCIVTIDHQGELQIEQGLVRYEDIPKEPDVATDGEGEDDSAAMQNTVTINTMPASTSRSVPAADDEDKEPGLSQSLTAELTATRSQIMKAYLATDFAAAFDLMVYTLARNLFSSGYSRKPINVTINDTQGYDTKDAVSDGVVA